MNAITESRAAVPALNSLMPANLDQAMSLANIMAKGRLVPSHLQNAPADCLLVIEQAMRWGMSPFAVAQCTSVIKGKLMFEGKLVAAAVQTSGAIIGHLDYKFEGAGPDRTVVVSARRVGDDGPREVRVRWADARTDNPLWTKQPDQQLAYHGARVWARLWVPSVMLGVYSREEMAEDGTPPDTFAGQTIEATAEAPAAPVEAPLTMDNADTVKKFLMATQAALDAAATADAVDAIIAHARVQKALDGWPDGPRRQLQDMLNAAMERTAPADDGWPGPDGDVP